MVCDDRKRRYKRRPLARRHLGSVRRALPVEPDGTASF